MSFLKNCCFATLCLFLASSCTYYRGPQPAGAPDMDAFPSELHGTYLADQSKLVITSNKIEYWADKTKASMKSYISDSLHVRSMAPWIIGTRKSQFASGGDCYSVFALKLDENNPNILFGIQTDEDEIKQQFPNVRHAVEQHSVTTSDGVPEPPKDVTIFDPTPEEFRQIIEAAFEKKRKDADYKAFERQ